MRLKTSLCVDEVVDLNEKSVDKGPQIEKAM
jgi:hypothetical protein